MDAKNVPKFDISSGTIESTESVEKKTSNEILQMEKLKPTRYDNLGLFWANWHKILEIINLLKEKITASLDRLCNYIVIKENFEKRFIFIYNFNIFIQ
jgi:hypothetical protein